MTTLQKIGIQIRKARLNWFLGDAPMTQKELAHKTGLSSVFIGQVEKGAVNASVNKLEVIAEALGCTLDINITDNLM